MFRALLRFFALLLVAATAFAQVYKWVDDKGVTHYGERPPQSSKPQEVLNKLASPLPAAARANEDWQGKERGFRQRSIQTDAADEQKRQETARRQEQCNQQRDLLARLKQNNRTYTLDAKGERIYMKDDEREAATARQEQLVAKLCPAS